MALEIKLQLKQMQKLVMTTELRNAIKLLTMSRLELQQLVQQKLLENPFLEETNSDNIEKTEDTASFEAEDADDDKFFKKEKNEDNINFKKNTEEVNWDDYI